MIMHCSEIVNWELLWKRKNKQHIREIERKNKSRSSYSYNAGDKMFVITRTTKQGRELMRFKHKGPYEVLKIFINGTIQIKCNNFREIIHIRHVRPFYGKQKNQDHSSGERVP